METGIMSEQAKKLAQALRSIIPGPCIAGINDAAAELDRLADLCEVLTAERDTARSATASMLRRRDTVANELRCQCQALAAERDTMRAQVTTLAAERDDRAALVGKLREEAGRLGKELDYTKVLAATAEDGVKILSRALEQSRQELATLCEDRNALAEGVMVYRLFYERCESASGASILRAQEAVRAWERQHGHRADKKQEPARKADEVEEKPPLLDLRTLPVGTVCEAVEEMEICRIARAERAIRRGARFSILKFDPVGFADEVLVETNDDGWWIANKQPARVISTPKPTPQPEPYRAGLPALALRRAHKEWQDRRGDRLEVAANGLRGKWIWLSGQDISNVPGDFDVSESREKFGGDYRPHAATWSEVELKAARMLGKENDSACTCEDEECPNQRVQWFRAQLGITDPTRDMTALWAAFREGQRAS